MFLGEYRHTLDTKNRLFIPAKFREDLGETFAVFPSPDGCLFLYSQEAWLSILDQFSEVTAKTADRVFQRRFLQGSKKFTADKQGRFTLDPYHVEWAGLEKDVVIFGAMSRVEVWTPERYDKQITPLTSEELDKYNIIF